MAKTVVYELLAKFSGDTTGLERAASKAESVLSSAFVAIRRSAAIGVGGFTALAVAQARAIDQNRELAISVGISYSALQDIGLVARESGVSVEALTAQFAFMQRQIFNAATGADSAKEPFERLGLNIKDIINLSPDRQFEAIAIALAALENPTERNAIGAEILGRNFRALVPVIEDYKNKINDARTFNEQFGLSLSDIDTQKVDAMNDAVLRLRESFKGFANDVVIYMAEPITNAVDTMINKIKELRSALAQAKSALTGFVDFHEDLFAARYGIKKQGDVSKLYGTKFSDPFTQGSISSSKTFTSTATGNYAPAIKAATSEIKNATAAQGEFLAQTNRTNEAFSRFDSSVSDAFGNFFSSVSRGQNAMDSLRNSALRVMEDIVRSMFQMSFGGPSGGGLGGTIASALFGSFNFGGGYNPAKAPPPRKPFAKGGAFLNSSVMFPMSTGMGVGGEAGPEAIMPLARGPGGKLGVRSSGTGVTINQNLNFSLGVSQTVRAEIMAMSGQLKAMSIEAVQNGLNRSAMKT